VSDLHDAIYSFALLASLVCAGVVAAWDVARLVFARAADAETAVSEPSSRGARYVALRRALLGVAAAALLASVVVHARWGHGPTSAEPMRFGELLSMHPAFLWAATLLAFAGLPAKLLRAWSRERRGDGGAA
jgi:hypothetical protein